ncbi:hexose-6-phosphate:phosphate antiporter [Orbaceae bacterium ESL0727]|nr:hexose-6-phosphate:phosphate antiporter [Orbaceae bacterium ESL0727]
MNIISRIVDFYKIKPLKIDGISLALQRKQWLKEFFKSYLVLCLVYSGMYLLRYNFKAAQPLLKEYGFTTTDLGNIGVGFLITYGIGRVVLGYFIDGKNTKKVLSTLLLLSCLSSLCIGLFLATENHIIGLLILFWSINGLCQSPGGPCCNSTMNRWTPRRLRGRFIGWWNVSHNIGGALSGILALWGANYFFAGNVAGMFIFPVIIAAIIGIWGLFFGKDDPAELGWNKPEEIFNEPIAAKDIESLNMTKKQILIKYVVKNPAVWFLCLANLFVYMIRIGIDNWAPLYTFQAMNFTTAQAAWTLTFLEMGGFLGSMTWGYISDKLNGRRALVACFCSLAVILPLLAYHFSTIPTLIYAALFFEGFFIFGPVTLIGISIIGFAPKGATVVINAIPGTFGYIFGDSMAKILISRIADPTKDGLYAFGHHLHGWSASFTILYIAATLATFFLAIVALLEEKNIRRDKALTLQLQNHMNQK